MFTENRTPVQTAGAGRREARFAGRTGRGEGSFAVSDVCVRRRRVAPSPARCDRLAGWHVTCCKKGASP